MASFRMKFFLLMVSILTTVALTLYLPASTLVWISIVPSLVFSAYTKRLFLVLICLAVFLQAILIFVAAMAGTADEIATSATILIYLYRVIYPYGFEGNLIELMGAHVIFIISVFIIMIMIVAWFTRFDEFRTMIAFSFFISVFATFYILVNVFSYLIPPLRDFFLTNEIVRYVIVLFYGILPFIVLTIIFIFLFTIWDYKERKRARKDIAQIDRRLRGRRISSILKYLAVICFFVFLIVIIFAGVMQN